MKVICAASQKGGSGKTTSIWNLAVVAAIERGYRTVIIDTDDQPSAAENGDARTAHFNQETEPVVIHTVPARLSLVLKTAEGQGADLVFIDTPGNLNFDVQVQASDLVLMPSRPSSIDVRAVGATIQRIKLLGKEPIALLTAVSSNPKVADAGLLEAALTAEGITVCPTRMVERGAYRHSIDSGLGVIEMDRPDAKACTEVRNIFAYIEGKLGLHRSERTNEQHQETI